LASIISLTAHVEADIGKLDILVNNAGITRPAMIVKMTDQQWDDVIRVNLTAYFYTTRAALRSMKERKTGVTINISSLAAQRGSIGQINYASAKAGIIGLTKATAKEMARYGIRSNAICPGVIETEMTTKLLNDPKLRDTYLAEIPLARTGYPLDIARAASFLASDESSFITGQVFGVYGGAYV
jgi:3-oxoacyl-[acyl-carrier protein] reductase